MKKIIKIIWDESVYGGYLTSLGAPSIIWVTSIINRSVISWDVLVVIFLASESIYLFDRHKSIEEDSLTNPKRTVFYKKRVAIIPLLLFLYVMSFVTICIMFNKLLFLAMLLVLFILGMLYSAFLKPFSSKIIGFKSYVVIIMWAAIPLLYISYYKLSVTPPVIFITLFLILREVANCWFCDIKDIMSDSAKKYRTFATVYGKQKLLKLLNKINIVSLLVLILGLAIKSVPINSVFLIFSVLFAVIYNFIAFKKKPEHNEFLFSYLPDLEPISYLVFVIVGGSIARA